MPPSAPRLHRLECTPHAANETAPDVTAIASLTSVTALTLHGYTGAIKFQALSSLRLQDLSLYSCPEMSSVLITTEALASLAKLYIEEDDELEEFYEQMCSQAMAPVVHDLEQVRKALLSLPRLTEIAGPCKLVMLMACRVDRQLPWVRTLHDSCPRSNTVYPCNCYTCLSGHQKWIKAQ